MILGLRQGVAIAAAAVAVAMSVGAGIAGYRLGTAKATREAVARVEGERDAWRATATDALAREREWLQTAGQIQGRWDAVLADVKALQMEKPKTIREVIREGSACPERSVDPDTFGVLARAVEAHNRGRSAPGP